MKNSLKHQCSSKKDESKYYISIGFSIGRGLMKSLGSMKTIMGFVWVLSLRCRSLTNE